MSSWTHIIATIDVETFIEDIEIKTKVEDILKDAPKITGSEGNADIFVNILSDFNISKWNFEKDKFDHFQSRVVITIMGDLRDREIKKTGKEYCKFYNFIKNKFWIRNSTYKIIT